MLQHIALQNYDIAFVIVINITVHRESNELRFKEHLALNEE